MKQLLFALCLTLLVAPALKAQNPSTEEINFAVQYLEKTEAGVLAATKELSAAQWNFKPATNRWSVAEVTEHIAAAEDFLRGLIRDKVMTSPARTNTVDVKVLDEFVMKAISDRSVKVQAPEPLQPDNRFGSPQGSLEHFEESRARTIAFVKETDDLRGHAMASPAGKELDAYEWVLLIAAHSERHTKQINEVRADPNFPTK